MEEEVAKDECKEVRKCAQYYYNYWGLIYAGWSQGKKGGAKGGSWQQDKGSHGNQQQGGGKQKQYFS